MTPGELREKVINLASKNSMEMSKEDWIEFCAECEDWFRVAGEAAAEELKDERS